MNFISKLLNYSKLTYNSGNVIIRNSHRYVSSPKSLKLKEALEEAEKVVSVPVSHFGITSLMNNEFDITTFAIENVHSQSIVESNHPIVSVTKTLFKDDNGTDKLESNFGGITLLLVAKASECVIPFKNRDYIFEKQKSYAEIHEMIDKGLYIHQKGILNISLGDETIRPKIKCLNDGNKISVLSGDYLFAYAIAKYAQTVGDTIVLENIGKGIDEVCSSNFKGERDSEDNLLPWNSISILDWECMSGDYNIQFMANGCKNLMILAQLSETYQKAAYNFGYRFQLIRELKDELNEYNDPKSKTPLKLISAPIIYHIENDSKFLIYLKNLSSRKHIDYSKIRQIIINGDAIGKCNALMRVYAQRAVTELNVFPDSEAKEILIDTVNGFL